MYKHSLKNTTNIDYFEIKMVLILLERLLLVLFEQLCSKWTFKTGGKQYNKQVVETQ